MSKKVKVNALQVFNSKNDVRKCIYLDIEQEDREYFQEEYGIDWRIIDEILSSVKMYIQMEKLHELEVVLEEGGENHDN